MREVVQKCVFLALIPTIILSSYAVLTGQTLLFLPAAILLFWLMAYILFDHIWQAKKQQEKPSKTIVYCLALAMALNLATTVWLIIC